MYKRIVKIPKSKKKKKKCKRWKPAEGNRKREKGIDII